MHSEQPKNPLGGRESMSILTGFMRAQKESMHGILAGIRRGDGDCRVSFVEGEIYVDGDSWGHRDFLELASSTQIEVQRILASGVLTDQVDRFMGLWNTLQKGIGIHESLSKIAGHHVTILFLQKTMTQLCSNYNTLCSYDCSLPHQMSAMKDRISFLKNRLLWELERALLVVDVVLGNTNFLTFLRIEDRQFLEELHATHERCQQLLEKDKSSSV